MANKCASKLKNKVTGEIYDVKDAAARADIETLGDDLENKVDKSKVASTIYATNANGEQTHLKFATAANPDTVVVRTPTGHIMSMSPTSDNHAATKKYVDDHAGVTIEKIVAVQDSVDENIYQYFLEGYKFYILTAYCYFDDGVYATANIATWIMPASVIEKAKEREHPFIYTFPPYQFTSTNDMGEDELHTLTCEVYFDSITATATVSCSCSGATVETFIEGVK